MQVLLTKTGIQYLESRIHVVESIIQDCLGFPYGMGRCKPPQLCSTTVKPRFNEPLKNEVHCITNDFLYRGQNYNKMCGTEPRFNGILVITNTIQKRKRKIYLDVTNKCQHVIERYLKMKAKQTDEDKIYVYSSFKQFCLPVFVFIKCCRHRCTETTATYVQMFITEMVQNRKCWALEINH